MAVELDPSIWRALPEELQEVVIAHLPLTKIFQLQLLSKKWRDGTVTGNDSLAFRKACAKYSPKLFAVVSEVENELGTFHIRTYDTKLRNWYSYDMKMTSMPDLAMDLDFHQMTASDGGLICCVSRLHSHPPLVIVVCNPLTREMKALPASKFLSMVQPEMVQLVMDRSTKVYEVILAGWIKGRAGSSSSSPAGDSPGEFIAEIYNSQTGAWSDINNSVSDCYFGYQYSQGPQAIKWSLVPMLLDCQEGQLLHLNKNPWQDLSRVSLKLDLVKDHLFTLETGETEIVRRARAGLRSLFTCTNVLNNIRRCKCIVTEYRGQKGNHSWVEVNKHEIPSKIWDIEWGGSVRFYACTGFLLIISISYEEDEDEEITLLYDLSTRTCQRIPAMPDRVAYEDHHFEHVILSPVRNPKSIMCELQWDAIP